MVQRNAGLMQRENRSSKSGFHSQAKNLRMGLPCLAVYPFSLASAAATQSPPEAACTYTAAHRNLADAESNARQIFYPERFVEVVTSARRSPPLLAGSYTSRR
jgi:hypothetical protein